MTSWGVPRHSCHFRKAVFAQGSLIHIGWFAMQLSSLCWSNHVDGTRFSGKFWMGYGSLRPVLILAVMHFNVLQKRTLVSQPPNWYTVHCEHGNRCFLVQLDDSQRTVQTNQKILLYWDFKSMWQIVMWQISMYGIFIKCLGRRHNVRTCKNIRKINYYLKWQ